MTAYLLHCGLLTSNFRVPLFYDIHVVKVHMTSYFVLIFLDSSLASSKVNLS